LTEEVDKMGVLKRVALFVGLLGVVAILYSTTIIPVSIEEMTRRSDLILRGKVLSIDVEEEPETHLIYQKVSISPIEVYKGNANGEIEIYVMGGTLNGLTADVPGSPQFELGEEVLVFLTNYKGEMKWVFGLSEGKFRIEYRDEGPVAVRSLGGIRFVDEKGRELVVRSEFPLSELISLIQAGLK
jgi:hypothetical protein